MCDLTLPQLAKYLRISSWGLKKAIRIGDYRDMPNKTIGKRKDRRFDSDKVMTWIEQKFNPYQ